MIEKAPKSSSLGRILDAISCYLGICCSRTYDGEPAIKLERYLSIGKPSYCFNREIKGDIVGTIDLFRQLDEKIKKPLTERQKADYAFSMVKTIVDSLSEIAINYASENNIKSVGVSGGVSYNIPIIEMIEKNVQKSGLKLIVHNRVPNGDGCIGIGQNAIIGNKLDH